MATNERLAEERAMVSAVLENVAAGVLSIDASGRILTCNGAALRMLRQREGEVVGRPAGEAWGDPERAKLAAALAAEGRSGRRGREVHLVLGGEWRTFEVKITPMLDAAGQPTGRVVVLEDLCELIRAQKLAAWNEAARRIAHEIKNPLTPIQLSAERLLSSYRQGDAASAAPSRRRWRPSCVRWGRCRRWSTSSRASLACRHPTPPRSTSSACSRRPSTSTAI